MKPPIAYLKFLVNKEKGDVVFFFGRQGKCRSGAGFTSGWKKNYSEKACLMKVVLREPRKEKLKIEWRK